MPIADYKCEKCGQVALDMCITPVPYRCYNCGAVMVRLPSAPNFKVNGYSAKNGYSSGDK